MQPENKNIKCKKLDEWLDGVSLEEKIKTLETGKMLACTRCGFTIFDKEKPEERKHRCVPSGYEHSFVEDGNYIILKRGFVNIEVAFYRFGTLEEAIIRHFIKQR